VTIPRNFAGITSRRSDTSSHQNLFQPLTARRNLRFDDNLNPLQISREACLANRPDHIGKPIKLDVPAGAHHHIADNNFYRVAPRRFKAREPDRPARRPNNGATTPEAIALRRHVKSCDGSSSFDRAIADTLAPATNVSPTILAFSSLDHGR
jgi:hypothetical protein